MYFKLSTASAYRIGEHASLVEDNEHLLRRGEKIEVSTIALIKLISHYFRIPPIL